MASGRSGRVSGIAGVLEGRRVPRAAAKCLRELHSVATLPRVTRSGQQSLCLGDVKQKFQSAFSCSRPPEQVRIAQPPRPPPSSVLASSYLPFYFYIFFILY